MTKRGRPTRSGERYKCGKRTPTAIQEDMRRVALEARMRVFGLKPERAYMTKWRDEDGKVHDGGEMTGWALAGSNIMGHPLNMLQNWGHITANQAIAGHEFALTLRDYLATGRLQRPTQGKAGFVPGTPDNSDGKPVKGEVKAKRYMEALAEIDRSDPFSGPSTTSVVWDICINEKHRFSVAEIGALRVGLNAVHRVWYGRKAA